MDLPFDMPDMDMNLVIALGLALVAELAMAMLFKYYANSGMRISLFIKIICYVALPFISYAMVKFQAGRD